MLETHYRASRFCRVLGNPTAFEFLKILTREEKTPTELAEELGLSLKTASATLRHLRQINLVRYTTKDNHKVYSLKDNSLSYLLSLIEKYIRKMRVIKW